MSGGAPASRHRPGTTAPCYSQSSPATACRAVSQRSLGGSHPAPRPPGLPPGARLVLALLDDLLELLGVLLRVRTYDKCFTAGDDVTVSQS